MIVDRLTFGGNIIETGSASSPPSRTHGTQVPRTYNEKDTSR
jgi:hypothetical protein